MKNQTYLTMLLEYFKMSKQDIRHASDGRAPYIPLTTPQMVEFYKNKIRPNPEPFLQAFEVDLYNLKYFYALAVGDIKDYDKAIFFFDKLMLEASDWSLVDTMAQRFIIAKKYRTQLLPLLKQYARVEDEFIQRIVAVLLLSHFLVEETIEEVIALIDHLRYDAYYTKMGVAWLVATINAKFPEKGIAFLAKNSLDVWTHNKSIQKSIESFRVSAENKATLRQMRRVK